MLRLIKSLKNCLPSEHAKRRWKSNASNSLSGYLTSVSQILSHVPDFLLGAFRFSKRPDSSIKSIIGFHLDWEDVKVFEGVVQGKEWMSIDPKEFNNQCANAMLSVTDEAFMYYLPLYAWAAIERDDVKERFTFCLLDGHDYFPCLKRLNQLQRCVLGECLLACLEFACYPLDARYCNKSYMNCNGSLIIERYCLPCSLDELPQNIYESRIMAPSNFSVEALHVVQQVLRGMYGWRGSHFDDGISYFFGKDSDAEFIRACVLPNEVNLQGRLEPRRWNLWNATLCARLCNALETELTLF